MFLSLSGKITGLCIWLVIGIYKVATQIFKVFLMLASGELLSPEKYQAFINNFYVIIGVVMLFVLAFSLLKQMITPDDSKQGTTAIRKIIINLVTSGIIMALLPTIFAFAYDFQDSILISGVNPIAKLFNFGGSGNANIDDNYIQVGAYQITNGVFTAFFNVSDDYCGNPVSRSGVEACQRSIESKDGLFGTSWLFNSGTNFADAINAAETEGKFMYYTNFAENVADGEIDFNFFLALIGGVLLAYMGISYCFDMALRLVKLVFYQLIAPIPLFLRIVPNSKLNGVFSQWIKVTLTCYLEVFVRIFILYFCVYLCKAMITSDFLSNDIYSQGLFLALITKAFVILGIIMFMRQAPKLLQQITGLDSGNMKLGLKDKLKDSGLFTAGAALGAGATSLVNNAVASGREIKNKWQKDKEKGVSGGKRALHAFTGVARGVGSAAAGAASGAVRGGKAGYTAKSAKEMKAAASTGAKGAIEARAYRANYKDTHGGAMLTFKKGEDGKRHIGGTIAGHATDAFHSAAEWAGIELSYAALQAERKASDELKKHQGTIASTSEDYINKHKNEFYAGLNAEQTKTIENLLRKRNEAKNSKDGRAADGSTLSQIEAEINRFEDQEIDVNGKRVKIGSRRLDVLEKELEAIKARGARNETDEEYKARIQSKRSEFEEINNEIKSMRRELGNKEGANKLDYERQRAELEKERQAKLFVNDQAAVLTLENAINDLDSRREVQKKNYEDELKLLENEGLRRANQVQQELNTMIAEGPHQGNFARELADAENDYKKSLKDTIDAFVGIAQGHAGAEKEATIIKQELGIMNDVMKENANSLVVKALQNGDSSTPIKVEAMNGAEITSENSQKYMKQMKAAIALAETEVSRKYEEKQRRDKSKKGNGN